MAGHMQHGERQVADADRLAFDEPARRRDVARVGDAEALRPRFEIREQEGVALVRPLDRQRQGLAQLGGAARMIDMAVRQQDFSGVTLS